MTESTPLTAQRLLAESDWLRALARQLMREEDRAEDLFQDTVLASLNDHSTVRGAARPWLSRVARNLALRSRRGEDRRAQRERIAAVSEVHVEPVERLEMLRRVVDAVHGMDEPSRTVLLLRYWEDLPPREIAVRMAVPVGTVKTQLKRGLQVLRARLDGEFGSRQAWIAVLLPVLPYGTTPLAAGTGLAAKEASLFASKKGALGVLLAFAILGGVVGFGELSGAGEPELDAPEQASLALGEIESKDLPRPDITRVVKGERKRVNPKVSMPGSRGNVRLRVVRKGTNEPLPNVSVNYWNPKAFRNPSPNELARVRQHKEDLYRVSQGDLQRVELYRNIGTEYRSDSQGLVRLPQAQSTSATASVIQGRLEGNMRIPQDAGSEPLVLELYPVTELTVEVVDQHGNAAAGVPVAWKRQLASLADFAVKTGINGHARMRLMFARGSTRIGPKGYVVIALPMACHVAVDLDRDMKQPVRLVLPATGALDVTLQDVSGQRLDLGHVIIHDHLSGAAKPARWMQASILASMRFEEGRFSFPAVGLERRFDIVVHAQGRSAPFMISVLGPKTEGETVRATLQEQAKQRIVSFRLLDSHRIPMADTPLRFSLHTLKRGRSQSYGTSVRTDMLGKLQIILSDPHEKKSVRRLSLNRRTRGWVPIDDPSATVVVDLSRPFPMGLTDLPEVVMTSAPLVVAGMVTTSTEEPLSDVVIRASEPESTSSGPGLVLDQDVLRSESADDGGFAIRGLWQNREVSIAAKKKGWFLASPARVEVGTTGLRLTMARTGSMRGNISGDLPATQLRFVMVPRVPIGSARRFKARLQKNSFRFSDLPPGAYEFRVRLQRVSEAVFTLPVEILGGTESEPPLLQDLDLSDQLRLVSITVLDPQRQALAGVKVWRRGSPGLAIETNDSGVARILCPCEGTDLAVNLADYQRVHLVGVVSDKTIVMKLPIDVQVRVDGTWPEDGTMTLSFEEKAQVKGLWRDRSRPERPVVRDGTSTLRFPAPGAYLVHLAFAVAPDNRDEGATSSPQLLTFMPAVEVTIRDHSDQTPIFIKVDSKGLDKVLRIYRSGQKGTAPREGHEATTKHR